MQTRLRWVHSHWCDIDMRKSPRATRMPTFYQAADGSAKTLAQLQRLAAAAFKVDGATEATGQHGAVERKAEAVAEEAGCAMETEQTQADETQLPPPQPPQAQPSGGNADEYDTHTVESVVDGTLQLPMIQTSPSGSMVAPLLLRVCLRMRRRGQRTGWALGV